MSSLVDFELRRWAEGGAVRPYDPALVNPASINLRIGTTAKVETERGIMDLDLGAYDREIPFLVPPGGWILTDVMETIKLASDLEGLVVLRSSAARRGWDHAMAGFVDPGYGPGKLTLEFVNCLRFHALPIYPGQQLVQLRVSMLQVLPERDYSQTGRYQRATRVEGNKDPSL